MERIYLDHAAGTPVDPEVMKSMEPYFSGKFGNPGSVHSFGQEAIAAIDHARETVATSIGAEFRELIFTSSATEANNLALRGAVKEFSKKNPGVTPRVIVSSVEHESILETARDLAREGVLVHYVPVNTAGVVSLKNIKELLDGRDGEHIAIVSVMYAQNEIGTVQPIEEIVRLVKGYSVPLFHTDAAQAFQFLSCNVKELGIDLMTLSSHKIYGPKGAGALYIRGGVVKNEALAAQITGGGQEFGMRSGTENVPAIVGFAKAVELIVASREHENKKIRTLTESLWEGIKKIYPDIELNGGMILNGRPENEHLPNILNVYFPGHRAEDLLTKWDLAGLAASSGSACRSRAVESSYVIEAMGLSSDLVGGSAKDRARESVRFSLGRPTSAEDIAKALEIIEKAR